VAIAGISPPFYHTLAAPSWAGPRVGSGT